MIASAHGKPRGLTHSALFYRSAEEYLDAVMPFIADGLATGEPVLVAVPTENVELLRAELGDTGAEVTMVDLRQACRNPGRILGISAAFAAAHPEQPVRFVGEPVWPGRTADEYPACVQHEAFVNAAFEDRQARALCPYNAAELDPGMLADARMTHPLLWNPGSVSRNTQYAPDDALALYNQPLPRNAGAVGYTVRTTAELSPARSLAARYGGWLGLSRDAIADLKLIATELATTSLRHGACRLAFWQRSEHVVCEARGRGWQDPLAGCLPPRVDGAISHGLYLAHALADLVRTHVTATGTTIQAHLRTMR